MKTIGKMVKKRATFYLTGGATAIFYGFREGTIDIDIAGDMNEIFSYIPHLKESMQINIEWAKPTDFVPPLHGEHQRHLSIGTFGKAIFMHFDPYSQAFSKIVRGHQTDMIDTKALIASRFVDATVLLQLVKQLSDHDYAPYTRLSRSAVEAAVMSFVKSVHS
jgi:hypothetical protein